MKISVIVPVYNVESFLGRCLDSIIKQTLSDIEIICINDGSTDGSLKILEDYQRKDSRIKIIDQPSSGPSVSRNAGIKIAQGEYISFVDSDDWIDEKFLEKLYTAAKKYDADIAAAGVKTWRKCNRTNLHLSYKKEECTEDIDEKYRLCDIPETCNVWNRIYRTSELRKHKIEFEPGVYYEDVCFSCEVLYYLKRLVTVPEVNYNYFRGNKNSIVKIRAEKIKRDAEHVHSQMLKFWKDKNISTPAHWRDFERRKIFGITVLKIRYRSTKRDCKLFNFIKFELPPV